MKHCKKCNTLKEYNQFNTCKAKKDGLSTQCKECNKNNLKNHYNQNKSYYREKNNKRRAKTRDYIKSLKLKCSNCQESDPVCLDFHHTNPSTKHKSIGNLQSTMRGINKINEEIAKCIVLCANCHRKLHHSSVV